ncbi:hypothetical protein EMIHUDRAFT_245897 [Emiliania huxleyi CCMP1516]|uniref:Uncharacterized protein n=2 Tax=Emiliania huxleyi TaxID=2903 RepID=A0A0D3IVG4_EMIH1|nr:hypothetical protein EMIHUDRAFT_245897 [Emiliania huxleyi CCMP1516]EOD15249.1 hypothetical protein EMIHUDRAFT_245897 [Emiliania huxleyi CCMP1516]|eukprot:XP_005767678.1 hypothetical protein EMIHUDRAFT_245897 [Emiliania huxleyi CCMP1516]
MLGNGNAGSPQQSRTTPPAFTHLSSLSAGSSRVLQAASARLLAGDLGGGPILGNFGRTGTAKGSIAVQRGTDSVRAGYRLGRLRAGSIAVYLVLK